MDIGILGTGRMGAGLGRLWAKCGHRVTFGSRDAAKAKKLAEECGHGAKGGSYADAARDGEAVVLAVPWRVAEETVVKLPDLAGKVLVDLTNPFAPEMKGLAVGQTESAAERIAAKSHGAHVVKAFNSVGFENLDATQFSGPRPALFLCGDDEGAKARVSDLGSALGFEPVDAGPLVLARALEPLAWLWVDLAFARGLGRNVAFSLVRR